MEHPLGNQEEDYHYWSQLKANAKMYRVGVPFPMDYEIISNGMWRAYTKGSDRNLRQL